ncbi:hypothetical protein JCM9492_00100 [Aquifex pyrophilus]
MVEITKDENGRVVIKNAEELDAVFGEGYSNKLKALLELYEKYEEVLQKHESIFERLALNALFKSEEEFLAQVKNIENTFKELKK